MLQIGFLIVVAICFGFAIPIVNWCFRMAAKILGTEVIIYRVKFKLACYFGVGWFLFMIVSNLFGRLFGF